MSGDPTRSGRLAVRERMARLVRAYGVWIVTLAAGGAAAWAVHAHLARREDELLRQSRVPTVSRIVASRDLPAGTRLDADMLALREVPARFVPDGALAAEEAELLLSRQLGLPVQAGQMILQGMATAPAPASLASRIAPGRRALTLAAHDFLALPRPLQAGDRLDIYVSITHEARALTLPLLAAGRVLSVTAPEAGEIDALTLEATPEEAVRVIAARQAGALTAVLRTAGDTTQTSAQPQALEHLLGLHEAAAPPAEVQVLYGDAEAAGQDGAPAQAREAAGGMALEPAASADDGVVGVRQGLGDFGREH